MQYDIEVKKSRKGGRGVFALRNFKKGEVIEKCPILKLTVKERNHCEKTMLAHYMYPWRTLNDAAIVLGYGSIYNHLPKPESNAKWIRDYTNLVMVYKAVADIKKGEEILIDYNGDYEEDTIDWFTIKK